ncbi:unnamed protein product [marine sediment metagenome]|uniref:Uncharacterized protein n=1 Tax=marine sediment metagenome TaxID=412755 RepID=X1D4V3_9ZZZZ
MMVLDIVALVLWMSVITSILNDVEWLPSYQSVDIVIKSILNCKLMLCCAMKTSDV